MLWEGLQLPGTRKKGNISTLLPIVKLQQEISRTLFAVHTSLVHMASSCSLSLIPYFSFFENFAQDVKALLVFLTISTTASQDVDSCFSNKQFEKSRRSSAVCHLLARHDHQRDCTLSGKVNNLTD